MYLSKFYDSVLQPTAMLVAVSMSIVCITVLCHYFLVIAIARDKKGRVHYMEIQLDKSYPKSPPSISVDVPCVFNLKWSKNSRLKDLLLQFREHLEKLQEIWSILDEIDKSLWVVNLNQLSHANTCRQINLGNDCSIMLCIHPNDPKSLPECRFMGSGQALNSSRKTWQRNSKRWNKDKPFLENVANLLDAELPRPPDYQNGDQHVECGICYAQYLPMMSWDLRVEVELIINVITPVAVGLFILSVLQTGCAPLQQHGGHMMFCLAIVHTVQTQLL